MKQKKKFVQPAAKDTEFSPERHRPRAAIPHQVPKRIPFQPCLGKQTSLFFKPSCRIFSIRFSCIAKQRILAAFQRRARLGRPDCFQPAQHRRAPRGLSLPLRSRLGPGKKNSGPDSEPARAQSRRSLRPAPARGGRDQDVDQGRHRAAARGQGHAFSRAHLPGRDGDSRARHYSLRAKHDALRDRRRDSLFLRHRLDHGAECFHGRLGEQQQVFHARRDARDRANGQLRAAAHHYGLAGRDDRWLASAGCDRRRAEAAIR